MNTKINSKTALKTIKEMAQNDFGIELTNAQAKEIKSSIQTGCATWTGERYITTRGIDDVNRMSASGVQYSAYKTFYKRTEWNTAVRAGEFN